MTTQPEQQTTGPEVVAWAVRDEYDSVGGEMYDNERQATKATWDLGGSVVPLVTLPDALTHAEAQVREAEARIVAWLREKAAPLAPEDDWGDSMGDTLTADVMRYVAGIIERGDHRA